MAKTKISEFNANPALNTDIDSINISEGCAPSGINDAIRELMAQLKDWQAGTSNDPMVIGSTGSLTLNQGTANGVAYLNGSKVVTSGSALTWDGSLFYVKPTNTQLVVGASFAKIENLGGASASLIMADTTDSGTIKNVASSIAFLNSSSEGMRLTSTGLGIGTSSPSTKLHVTSSTQAYPFRIQVTAGSTAGIEFEDPTTGTNRPNIASRGTSLTFETNSSERMRLDSSGNLGLGVTPSAWTTFKVLQSGQTAYASNGTTALFYGNTYFDGTERYITTGTAARFDVNNTSSQPFRWYTAASGTAGNAITFTQAMTLDASGNLLVGTTSTSVTNGAFVLRDSGAINSYMAIGHKNGSNSGADFLALYYNGTQIGGISQSGTTAVLFNVTSDQRLKENIVDAPEFGSVIDSIKVRSYDWKADGNHQRAGFVAQELITVAPEAVHQPVDTEQMMAVDYSKLVPMLVKEIQSLRARVAQLESN